MFIITSVTLEASVYKGQALFQKNCLHCHGRAIDCVVKKSTDQWEKIMGDGRSHLLDIHTKKFDKPTPEQLKTIEYFKSENFLKNVKNYKDFLFEYASDTNNIPACD
jgi:hypothetical protein